MFSKTAISCLLSITLGGFLIGCDYKSAEVSRFSINSVTEQTIVCDGGWSNTLMELDSYNHCENFNN